MIGGLALRLDHARGLITRGPSAADRTDLESCSLGKYLISNKILLEPLIRKLKGFPNYRIGKTLRLECFPNYRIGKTPPTRKFPQL